MMKTVIILQARMNSSRLPGKAALKLSNKSVLAHVITRLKNFSKADQLVLATTTAAMDDQICSIGQECRIPVFRGPEENVLERYYLCAKTYGADQIIRATADDPLTSIELLEKMFARHMACNADYTCAEGYPVGVQEEIVTFGALDRCYRFSDRPNHFEHVLEYIPEHPQDFRINVVNAEGKERRPDIRVTLDTAADFEVLQSYADNFKNMERISMMEIVDFWDRIWKTEKE